jgi:hypothetical protein
MRIILTCLNTKKTNKKTKKNKKKKKANTEVLFHMAAKKKLIDINSIITNDDYEKFKVSYDYLYSLLPRAPACISVCNHSSKFIAILISSIMDTNNTRLEHHKACVSRSGINKWKES